MAEHSFVSGNSSLYYQDIGKGEPVMLVHGFGEDSRIWEVIIKDLATTYRLIIPDLPGSGRSTGAGQGLTIDYLAEKILAVADHAGLKEFALIGHSMGGYIALAFAEKYDGRLSKLGLFHSSAFADNEEKKTARRKNIEFIRRHGVEKFMEQSVPKLFSEAFVRDQRSVVDGVIARYSNFSPDSLVYYTEAMMNRPDRTEVLKKISRPVLFILGEEDTAIPLEQGLKQSSIPEFSYIYIATHSGHMGMIEEPVFCLKAMKDFLAGI